MRYSKIQRPRAPYFASVFVVAAIATGACGGGEEPGETGATDGVGSVLADAGPDQAVVEGARVSLEAIGSGTEFSWAQVDGPAVVLEGADQAALSFEAPWIVDEGAVVELEVTVRDGSLSATDSVAVTISNTHFVLFLADKDQAGRVELYRADLDQQGEPIKLSKTPVVDGDVKAFKASPNGRYVAYFGDIEVAFGAELFTVATGGGTSTRLTGSFPSGDVLYNYRWAPGGDRIGYIARGEVNGTTELLASAPDGSSRVRLDDASVEFIATTRYFDWSPDGSRIAYGADQETDDLVELFSTALDGTGIVKINGTLAPGGTVATASALAAGYAIPPWSPDGRRLAYIADQETDDLVELFVSAADGTGNVRINGPLVAGGNVVVYAWSPDATSVAYIADQAADEVFELYTSAADGGDNVKLNGPLVVGGDVKGDFAWSPDGKHVAYIADQETDDLVELFVSAADGTGNVRINGPLVVGGNVVQYAWSPDSLAIAYLADQEADEVFELFVSAADGTGNVKINGTLAPGGDVTYVGDPSTPFWSPDGRLLAYLADQEVDELYEVFSSAPDGTNNHRVNGALVADDRVTVAAWSPAGDRIVYGARQGGSSSFELYSSAPDGTGNLKLSGAMAPGGSVILVHVE